MWSIDSSNVGVHGSWSKTGGKTGPILSSKLSTTVKGWRFSGQGSVPPWLGRFSTAIAVGCRYFIVCGGAGALHKDLTLGHFVVVSSALRDEGTSFHYLPPGRRIQADPEARRTLEAVLTSQHAPYVSGLTWTTDAPYRETSNKIAARRDEGCLTVEMEAAALAAIARFRGVPLAQVVYCGDDLSGSSWDHRFWQSLSDVREDLFDLTATAALALAHSNRLISNRRLRWKRMSPLARVWVS